MFIIQNYAVAVLFCFITMLCWGSWANTQKLASKSWRFELFYWDYVIGILLFSLLSGFTLGSLGSHGRSFVTDLKQASASSLGSAFIGGIIFNAANILLSAAIAIAGMSVAFPLAIGLALVLGVVVNYMGARQGNPLLLFAGVALVMVAIMLNALAYRKKTAGEQKVSSKGIVLSVVAGLLMSYFYRFIAASMDLQNFVSPQPGKMTPYSAVFVFSVGIFISNFLFNTILIKRPFVGEPTSYWRLFQGPFQYAPDGHCGRIDLGARQFTQPDCSGQSGAGHFVWAGAGRHAGGCALGCVCLERI